MKNDKDLKCLFGFFSGFCLFGLITFPFVYFTESNRHNGFFIAIFIEVILLLGFVIAFCNMLVIDKKKETILGIIDEEFDDESNCTVFMNGYEVPINIPTIIFKKKGLKKGEYFEWTMQENQDKILETDISPVNESFYSKLD